MSGDPHQAAWDDVYARQLNTMWWPNEDIVRFTARLVRRRLTWDRYEEKRPAQDVLDLGCGNGRHVVYFASLGFRTSGIDISPQAIEWGREWCRREGREVDLRVGDVTRLPHSDEAFDVVVSHGVLDHMPMEDARLAAEQVRRVLRPSGLFYCDLRSAEDSGYGRGRGVAPNTFVLEEGFEAGLVQHFFTRDEVDALFQGLFRPVYLETTEQRYGENLGERWARWVAAMERT
jgi:SAM-dependent methyltransferase